MQESYLYLIWKDPTTRRNFTVGKLTHGKQYSFSYLEEAETAKEYGWEYLKAFPEDKAYTSDVLFPTFSSRLPDRKRRDMNSILKKYQLNKYDEFELLKKSGARLPIDTYEFIDPIIPEDETIQRDFFIMGIRHQTACRGEDCDSLPDIKINERLFFEREPGNAYDKSAIRVVTIKKEHLGYVPRYFNAEILRRLDGNQSYSCIVLEINKDTDCSECVKVRLNIPSVDGRSVSID